MNTPTIEELQKTVAAMKRRVIEGHSEDCPFCRHTGGNPCRLCTLEAWQQQQMPPAKKETPPSLLSPADTIKTLELDRVRGWDSTRGLGSKTTTLVCRTCGTAIFSFCDHDMMRSEKAVRDRCSKALKKHMETSPQCVVEKIKRDW